jgi:hypothetical protein
VAGLSTLKRVRGPSVVAGEWDVDDGFTVGGGSCDARGREEQDD